MSALVGTTAFAQDATSVTGGFARLPLTVVPTFSASQTFTRNDSQTPGDQRSEAVTQLSPGVQVRLGSGRVRGFIDYALNTVTYGGGTGHNAVQQSLNASVNAEAIPNLAFIDASARIGQQPISAFGQQFIDNTVVSSNRAEVRSFSVTPSLRGSLNGVVGYDARLSVAGSRSDASSLPGSTSTDASLQFNGGGGLLRWALTGTRQRLDFNAGQANESDRLNASLSFVATPQLSFSVSGGRESTDYTGGGKITDTTFGGGASWRPSDATSLSLNAERRAYGDTHALSFSHRTAHSVWVYTDSRSATTGVGQPLLASLGTAFDLFDRIFTSEYPDPVLRQQKVLDYLKSIGQNDPNAQIIGGFLTSAVTLQHQQALSVAFQGLRQSAALSYTRSTSSRLDTVAGASDDFSRSDQIRQQSLALLLSHRLTPSASLNLNTTVLRTSGGATAPSSRLTSYEFGWADQIGRRLRANVSARRSIYAGTVSPYAETAVVAGISLTF